MALVAGLVWDPREPLPKGFSVKKRHNVPTALYAHTLDAGAGPNVKSHRLDIQQQIQRPVPDEFISRKPDHNVLHPRSTNISVKVIEDTAYFALSQVYQNASDMPIPKAFYTMPLPAGSAVVDFACHVGDEKIIKAKAKPKGEARESFRRALRSNDTVALLEQATPEVFTTKLGNIPAHTDVKIVISFLGFLKSDFLDPRDCNTSVLTIPTCLAARYGKAPDEFDESSTGPRTGELTVEIELNSAQQVRNISCDTHQITKEKKEDTKVFDTWDDFVQLGSGTVTENHSIRLDGVVNALDKDFVLTITTDPGSSLQPHAWLEHHPTVQGQRALMVTIPPKFSLPNAPVDNNSEILFLADRSGSMDDKIQGLKSAMKFFIRSIPLGRRFNVWSFGTSYSSLWPHARSMNSQEVLDEALHHIEYDFRPDMGGTEMLGALEAVVGSRNTSAMTDVIALTDGQVWQLDQTIGYARDIHTATNGKVRFFSLGIGEAVSHQLVEGLARAGGGYAEVIRAASKGGWEDRLVAMLESAMVGHIQPLRIELVTGDESVSTWDNIQRSPAKPSHLSPFTRNRLYMMLDPHTSPRLKQINVVATSTDGHETTHLVNIKPYQKPDAPIHKFAARALLKDLEDNRSWIQHDQNGPTTGSFAQQELTRKEGERLGCKWGLASKWTSFIAVDEPLVAKASKQNLGVDWKSMQLPQADHMDLLQPRGTQQPLRIERASTGLLTSTGRVEEGMEVNETMQDTGSVHGNYGRDRENEAISPDQTLSSHTDDSSEMAEATQTSFSEATGSAETESSTHEIFYGVEEDPDEEAFGSSYYPAYAYPTYATQPSRIAPSISPYALARRRHMESGDASVGSPADARMSSNTTTAFSTAPLRRRSSRRESCANARSSSGYAQNYGALAWQHSDAKSSLREREETTVSGLTSSRNRVDSADFRASDEVPTRREFEMGSEVKKEQEKNTKVVSSLMAFQKFDGSFAFDFPDLAAVHKAAGEGFVAVMKGLSSSAESLSVELEQKQLLVGTIAVVALFETRLPTCRHLWTLIVQKARLWIDSFFSSGAHLTKQKHALFAAANLHVPIIDLPDPTKGSGRPTKVTPLENSATGQSETSPPSAHSEKSPPKQAAAGQAEATPPSAHTKEGLIEQATAPEAENMNERPPDEDDTWGKPLEW